MFSFSPGVCRSNRKVLLGTAVTFVLILLGLSVSHAQSLNGVNSTGNEGNEEIQGTIHFPTGHKAGLQPVVKLQGVSSSELTALANLDGSFTFTRLRPDSYTITVNGGDEYENARESVAIGNSGAVPAQGNPWDYAHPLVFKVHIYLQPKRASAFAGSAGANNADLARVPQPARNLFDQAVESARRGESAKAIEQLQAAIAQDPTFALAYHELGMQYLKTGQAEKAADVLAHALKLAADAPVTRLNYGIALVNLKKFAAAEKELRQALQQNATMPSAHHYLGLALMKQQEFAAAEAEFKTAITSSNDHIAAAHKYLGAIYWHDKQYPQAADELTRYLTLEPEAPDADKIRGTIKELRGQK
jgi:thioredoxin-like negative regulator of GroEL